MGRGLRGLARTISRRSEKARAEELTLTIFRINVVV
jgi:hypothetical protein